jgi:hypothetical protein
MFANMRSFVLLITLLPNALSAVAQQGAPAGHGSPQSIRLNVHVAPKKGPETIGLQVKNFTVLDNHVAQPINRLRPSPQIKSLSR